jgi:YD repeat-containing protein
MRIQGKRGLSPITQATTDANGSAGFGATLTGTPRTWTYTYNAEGQVLTIDGPRLVSDVADVTTYAYHANNATCTAVSPGASTTGCRGQVASVTNALGHLTQITEYNAHGQPITIIDPNGLTTTLAYDTRMQLTSRNVGGELTTYAYDNATQLTRVTLPDLSYLEYVYDAAHRLTEMRLRDSLNNIDGKIVYTLDLMGNRTAENIKDGADAVLQARSREYNSLNRLIKDIGGTNPATQIIQYGYDNQGNLTSVDGPLTGTPNDLRIYTYDALNRLATMVDPTVSDPSAGGGTTTYAYNGLDQLASVTDARSLQTVYTHDGLNNLNQVVSPDTGTTVYNLYDEAGNLKQQTDAKGQVSAYTYDALNRVTGITYQGLVTHTYQYDQGTNGIGRLTTILEPNSTTQYGYDQKGRLTSETRTINAVAYVTSYGYDAAGRMTSITYPSGRQVTYTLDGVGRISRIDTSRDATTQTVVSSVAYRPFGPVKSFALGNAQTYNRGFDLDGRITSYTTGAQTVAVGYDNASRILSLTNSANPSNPNTYGYDNLDRLLTAVGPNTNQYFGYDKVGNRTSKVVGAASDTYLFSPGSNRLSQIIGANNRTYSYDNNGSVTGDSLNTFGYDARGRLIQATTAQGATGYQINSVGQRIRKTNAQGDTVYHYDAQGRLIAESSAGGQAWKEYVYLGDIPVAVIQ